MGTATRISQNHRSNGHKQHFTLTPQHVALLRGLYVDWSTYAYEGAPAVNLKRPYGSSDIVESIAAIIGIEPEDTNEFGDPVLSPSQCDACRQIHQETGVAMQVVLRTGSFEPGEYVADHYRTNWEPAAGT